MKSRSYNNYEILEFDSLDGTNAEAMRRIESGEAKNNMVILAEQQTAGRGRYDRVWQSQSGNLYVSVILKLDSDAGDLPQLSFVAAVALGNVLSSVLDVDFGYKWPNDILVEGKKLSGILLESVTSMGQDDSSWVVVGLGVNIENCPSNLETATASLKTCGADNLDKSGFLDNFLNFFDACLNLWKDEGFSSIREYWLARAIKINEEIEVKLPNEKLAGIFKGINEEGALELEIKGNERLISSGEVFFG